MLVGGVLVAPPFLWTDAFRAPFSIALGSRELTMSNMQDLDAQLAEKERQQRVYDAAMRKLAARRLAQEGEGLGIVYAWNAFGERSLGDTRLGRLSRLAEKFCIGFAFLTPCLLFARHMF